MEPFERDVKESLQFLTRYDWIHNFQVTRILKDKILSKIPIEWFSYLQDLDTQEINDLPFMESSSPEKFPAWPASLHSFLAEAAALSLARTQIQNISPTVVDAEMVRGMNPKKLHEVSWMASFVHDAACRADCNLIVDIGSGLGYLDHVLHQVYGHPVLGLETSESHLSAAEGRAVKQGLTCGGVKSLKFNITDSEECFKALERILDDFSLICQCSHTIKGDECKSDTVRGSESVEPTTATVVYKELAGEARNLCLTNATKGDLCCSTLSEVSSPRVCLIGLHCCGDLSTSALAMFHHLNCIKAVCCVSCCYHKMAYSDDCFMKFPLSSAGQKHYQEIRSSHTSCLLSPFTFRLGAQETRCRWRTQSKKEHSDHIRHVAFRGLLEMTDYDDHNTLRQKVRRCDFSTFDAFLTSYFASCNADKEDVVAQKAVLQSLYEKYKDDFPAIEILTCLQVVVQPVIETLIYKDRLLWLREKGYSQLEIVPIFDELVSPRNLAVLAVKSS